MITKCIKRALKRDDSIPVGQPAPLHVDCLCGRAVPISAAVNVCQGCGTVYDQGGWIKEGEAG